MKAEVGSSENPSTLSSFRPSDSDNDHISGLRHDDGVVMMARENVSPKESDITGQTVEIQLHGATCDIKSAYQQFFYSRDAALLRTTVLDVEHAPGHPSMSVLFIHLVGIFGDARAGHVYNVLGSALKYLHNRD